MPAGAVLALLFGAYQVSMHCSWYSLLMVAAWQPGLATLNQVDSSKEPLHV